MRLALAPSRFPERWAQADERRAPAANHKAIFNSVGLTPVDYPYYDAETIGLALPKFLEFLRSAPKQSVFLLHACAHNPTGVDPTREQWEEIAAIFKDKGHFAFFDCAYQVRPPTPPLSLLRSTRGTRADAVLVQGFASGDLDNDAWAVRHFVSQRIPLLVCQSYAKNAGLYGERIGALNLVASTPGDGPGGAARLRSQLLILQRQEISNPPTFGARIVGMILNDESMFDEWKRDVKTMAGRIIAMRERLHDLLVNELKTPAPGPNGWDHVTKQIGVRPFFRTLSLIDSLEAVELTSPPPYLPLSPASPSSTLSRSPTDRRSCRCSRSPASLVRSLSLASLPRALERMLTLPRPSPSPLARPQRRNARPWSSAGTST
mgnify:CR=1 FL=1